ncbi:MAG: DUF2207 domain-containing protein [Rhodovibrionaceae bacterium]
MRGPAASWRACAGILLFALLTGPAAQALADERILQFDAEIQVEADGDLVVSERIEVEAEGRAIKRGIFRDLTTLTESAYGLLRPEFEILQVTRGGDPEPYRVESTGEGYRIYLGDKDVLLRPGRYSYLLRYRLGGQIGFHADYDEVYWNVTGDAWSFPIERAAATVIPPYGYAMVSQAAYTGRRGETGRQVAFRRDDLGYPRWETTARLAPGEGLTVAVSWQKGLVSEPDTAGRLLTVLLQSRSTLIALGGVLLILVYYLVVWHFVGRDPRKGPIVAVYEAALPPAAMRFIQRKAFDRTAFVAALINMAVKGHLRIVERGGDYWLEKTESDAHARLSAGEAKVHDRLFAFDRAIELKQANRKRLTKAQTSLSDHLRVSFDKTFFSNNRFWFFGGLAITLIACLAVALTAQDEVAAIFMAVWLSIWTIGSGQLVLRALRAWGEVARGAVGEAPGAVLMTLFSVPFAVGWVVGAGFLFSSLGLVPAVFLVLVALVNILFFELLEARTPLGQETADEIEGLKLYLSVAEQDRLEFHNPPERTPEHFETLLPYALALGVEHRWAEQFDSVFAAIERQGTPYRPRWYVGHRFSAHDLGSFSNSFSSSLASASSAPSKSGSGGSFGGGSSGGGGGGGGGGGW